MPTQGFGSDARPVSSVHARQRRPTLRRHRSDRKLFFEQLEDRAVPSLTAVQIADIRVGAFGSNPDHLVDVNGTLFFTANNVINGIELWKSNGTAAGTMLVKDIRFESYSSSPDQLTNINGTLFFTADDGINGIELWKSDGTAAGTVMVKDIIAGSTSSAPVRLTNVNGTLFFAAADGVNGEELWKSDGTSAGTVLVKDIRPGSNGSALRGLINVNGTLFFSADDGTNGRELWKSDGTEAGTVMVKDIAPGSLNSGGYPYRPAVVNGTLFFEASGELWKSDGTEAGTVAVKPEGIGEPAYLTDVNGTLYFVSDGTGGTNLRKSDGTEEGTVLVKDIDPGFGNLTGYLTNVNGTLFFVARETGTGHELWKSNGTASGTVLVKDIFDLGLYSSYPNGLTNVNGTLFFAANDGLNGRELWTSDGTFAGTVMVANINSGANGSSPNNLTNVNGRLFFTADDGTTGRELWALVLVVPDSLGVARVNQSGGLVFSLDSNGNRLFDPGVDAVFNFGLAGDRIVVGDWDGDGFSQLGVARPNATGGLVFSLDSNGNRAFDPGVDAVFNFGLATDTIVVGDWTDSGADNLGVARPNTTGGLVFSLDSNGNRVFDPGVDQVFNFGLANDRIVVGDWGGTGTSKLGVARPNGIGGLVFSLDSNGNRSFDSGVDSVFNFGLATDSIIVGDWDGDGDSELGVARPNASGGLVFSLDTNGNLAFDPGIDQVFNFGLASDIIVTGAWSPPSQSSFNSSSATGFSGSRIVGGVLPAANDGSYMATDSTSSPSTTNTTPTDPLSPTTIDLVFSSERSRPRVASAVPEPDLLQELLSLL